MTRQRDERGSGLVSTTLGTVAFVGFLLLATQVLVGLYTTSVVTSVAWDNARRVAASNADAATIAAANADIQTRLSALHDVQIDWQSDDTGAVGLHVRARRPMFLPGLVTSAANVRVVDRTVWVRHEELVG